MNLERTRDKFVLKAVNTSKGPIVIESFGFEVAGKQFSIRMARAARDAHILVGNSVKLEQNETHREQISTLELSGIFEEELGLNGLFKFRGLYVDSHSKVWPSTQAMEITTEDWWPPEDGRSQRDSYGGQRWRSIEIIK